MRVLRAVFLLFLLFLLSSSLSAQGGGDVIARARLLVNNGDAKAASTLLMIEKIEQIVGKQVEAIKNLKIEKITVWDSGSGGTSSTANFLSSMIKSPRAGGRESLPTLPALPRAVRTLAPMYRYRTDRRKEPPRSR